MKKLFLIALVSLFAMNVNAQTWVSLSSGSTADTLIQSATFSKTFKNATASAVPTVVIQIAVDSVSGVPGATATLYKSIDNVNWETTGVSKTFLNGSDTAFYLVDTSFTGLYGKVEIVGNGTTQKSRIKATKMQW